MKVSVCVFVVLIQAKKGCQWQEAALVHSAQILCTATCGAVQQGAPQLHLRLGWSSADKNANSSGRDCSTSVSLMLTCNFAVKIPSENYYYRQKKFKLFLQIAENSIQ